MGERHPHPRPKGHRSRSGQAADAGTAGRWRSEQQQRLRASREEMNDRRPAAGSFEDDPWRLNEAVRRRRVQEDAQRSLGENLSEGLALTEFLSSFTGICRR